MAGRQDGHARGWTRETLEWMYQREIAKGQQKWEVAGRMAEQLGKVGPRVVKDIADSFTDGIANADEGLRMIHAIWEKDAGLADNVLHGLSIFGRAGTKQHQGARARVLFDLAKEHDPGSPEWNRIAELGQRPGFLPGLLEADTSLNTIEGFPVDEDAGALKGQSLLQHEVGELLSQTRGLVTPGIIDLYRSHYAAAYSREYSETMIPTVTNTPERLARVEVARMAARDAILGRWVGIDGLMLTTQQLALTPEMARDPAVAEYIEASVRRFQGELDLLPESPSLGTPMTHRFFSPDNNWTYLPGGITDEDEPQIAAFMAIEPLRRIRRVIWQDNPEFRPLLRASGITITTETVGPSGRFIWHPQFQVRSVEEFAAKFHGETYVEEFYISASEAWIDEGEGPPDLDNRGFMAFLDTYAKRHKWDGWMSGTTIRGETINPFELSEPPTDNVIRRLEPSP
ncbi:MAG: hypothetical protein IID31_12840 [Planctomycetes bacterium]|nr:hypothetical protein [Planctomycetota bacterium]